MRDSGRPHLRSYPPLTTVGMFVDQVLGADQSCQDTVAQELSSRVAFGLSESSPDTGAYCKARKRLSPELLVALSKTLAQNLCKVKTSPWLWRGREIKLIDGTAVTMPDTDKNQAKYLNDDPPAAGKPYRTSSSFHQNDYTMKSMDFSVWLGARRRHSRSYGNDEHQRQAGKDAISCKRFGETDY